MKNQRATDVGHEAAEDATDDLSSGASLKTENSEDDNVVKGTAFSNEEFLEMSVNGGGTKATTLNVSFPNKADREFDFANWTQANRVTRKVKRVCRKSISRGEWCRSGYAGNGWCKDVLEGTDVFRGHSDSSVPAACNNRLPSRTKRKNVNETRTAGDHAGDYASRDDGGGLVGPNPKIMKRENLLMESDSKAVDSFLECRKNTKLRLSRLEASVMPDVPFDAVHPKASGKMVMSASCLKDIKCEFDTAHALDISRLSQMNICPTVLCEEDSSAAQEEMQPVAKARAFPNMGFNSHDTVTRVLKASIDKDIRRLQVSWSKTASSGEIFFEILKTVENGFALQPLKTNGFGFALFYINDESVWCELAADTLNDLLCPLSSTLRIFVKTIPLVTAGGVAMQPDMATDDEQDLFSKGDDADDQFDWIVLEATTEDDFHVVNNLTLPIFETDCVCVGV